MVGDDAAPQGEHSGDSIGIACRHLLLFQPGPAIRVVDLRILQENHKIVFGRGGPTVKFVGVKEQISEPPIVVGCSIRL